MYTKPQKLYTKICSTLPRNRKGIRMSAWLIIVTGVIYTYIAAEQGYKGNMGMAVCYFGYALGNIGLYMMATK